MHPAIFEPFSWGWGPKVGRDGAAKTVEAFATGHDFVYIDQAT